MLQISFNKNISNINYSQKSTQPKVKLSNINQDSFIAFGSKHTDKSLKSVLERQGKHIPERVKKLAEEKVLNGIDDTLWNVQKEAYAGLKDCKNLSEIKRRFPEFADVIPAEDVLEFAEDKSNGRERPNFYREGNRKSLIYKLKDGEFKETKMPDGTIKEFTIENFPAEIIKLMYAENYSLAELFKIFNSNKTSFLKLLTRHLGIPVLNREYSSIRNSTNEEKHNKARKTQGETWQKKLPEEKAEFRAKLSVKASEAWQNKSPEEIAEHIENWKASMQARTPEEKAAWSTKQVETKKKTKEAKLKVAYKILGKEGRQQLAQVEDLREIANTNRGLFAEAVRLAKKFLKVESYAEFTKVFDEIMTLKETLYMLKKSGTSNSKIVEIIKFPKFK